MCHGRDFNIWSPWSRQLPTRFTASLLRPSCAERERALPLVFLLEDTVRHFFPCLSKRMCQWGTHAPPCLGPSPGYMGIQNQFPSHLSILAGVAFPELPFPREQETTSPVCILLGFSDGHHVAVCSQSTQNLMCVWNLPITKYTHSSCTFLVPSEWPPDGTWDPVNSSWARPGKTCHLFSGLLFFSSNMMETMELWVLCYQVSLDPVRWNVYIVPFFPPAHSYANKFSQVLMGKSLTYKLTIYYCKILSLENLTIPSVTGFQIRKLTQFHKLDSHAFLISFGFIAWAWTMLAAHLACLCVLLIVFQSSLQASCQISFAIN